MNGGDRLIGNLMARLDGGSGGRKRERERDGLVGGIAESSSLVFVN